MKQILSFLLFLLPALAFAQWPAAPNKIRLGNQTTGDGLIVRTDSIPDWTPADRNNAWLAFDTVANLLYFYEGGTWQEYASGTTLTAGSGIEIAGDSINWNGTVTQNTSLDFEGNDYTVSGVGLFYGNYGEAYEDSGPDVDNNYMWRYLSPNYSEVAYQNFTFYEKGLDLRHGIFNHMSTTGPIYHAQMIYGTDTWGFGIDTISPYILKQSYGTGTPDGKVRYRFPITSPSFTLNDTTIMAWRGTGSAAEVIGFIPLPSGAVQYTDSLTTFVTPSQLSDSLNTLSIIDSTTASNGLTEVANNIKLGGALTENTTLTGGNYGLTVTRSTGGNTLTISNTDNTFGVSALSVSAANVTAISATNSTNSYPTLSLVNSTGIGLQVGSTGGNYAAFANTSAASSASVLPALLVSRGSNGGVGNNNIGVAIDLAAMTSNGLNRVGHKLISQWTTATDASRKSTFSIQGFNTDISASPYDQLALSTTGQLRLHRYTTNSFIGTGWARLAVDASGVVVADTTTTGGGGPANLAYTGTADVIQLDAGGTPVFIAEGSGVDVTQSGDTLTIAADTAVLATVSAVGDTATTIRNERAATTGRTFSGEILLDNLFGVFYSDYTQTGTINFTAASSGHKVGSQGYMRLTSNASSVINFSSDFNYIYGFTSGLALEAGTYEIYFHKTPSGISVNIPAAVPTAVTETDPLTLSPYIALIADSTSTITESGGVVEAWASVSPGTYTVRQPTAGNRPQLETTGSFDHVRFVRANSDVMFNDTIGSAKFNGTDLPYSFVGVMRKVSSNTFQTIWSAGSSLGTRSHYLMQFDDADTLLVSKRETSSPDPLAQFDVNIATQDTSYHIIAVSCTGTTITAYVDGVKVVDAASQDAGAYNQALNQFAIGALRRNTTSNWWDGEIRNFYLYDTVLSDSNLLKVSTFLNNIYSIY